MNELQIFNHPDFGEVRTVTINDEPWLVGKDVAQALGYQNPQKALRDHVDDDEKTVNESFTVNGTPAILINESGMYSLILSSKLPGAKEFKRWVTSEVLPSIRKHGAYMTPETLEAAILSPDYLLKVVTALKDETDKRKALEAVNSRLTVENQIMYPKADYFDELVDRNLLTNFRETAKELGVPPKKFVQFLMGNYGRDGYRADYRDGVSYRGRKRDSMGRYSRADAKEDMVDKLRRMIDEAPDSRTREALEKAVRCMEE